MKPHQWTFVRDGFQGVFVQVTDWKCSDCGTDGKSWKNGEKAKAIDSGTGKLLSSDCLLVLASKVMEK